MFLKGSFFHINLTRDYFLRLFSLVRIENSFSTEWTSHYLLLGFINPLSTSFTKWSNTLKQFVGNLPTNCLSVYDHFVKLALKALRLFAEVFKLSTTEKRDVSPPDRLGFDDRFFDR